MKNHSVAIERWSRNHEAKVIKWLEDCFGKNNDRWGIDIDHDLETLWMNEDVYFLYLLRWE